MKKSAAQLTLWRWISIRVIALAISSVVLIAFCMWFKFTALNLWVIHNMPEEVKAEFNQLRENPIGNRDRYQELIDQYFGVEFSDPVISAKDWLTLTILVLFTIPIIVVIGLWSAKSLSLQFSQLAHAARLIAEGRFNCRVSHEADTPSELISLTHDFNLMANQLENYDRELRASNVAMTHELRTPLTAAMGRLQGILDGVFDANQQQLQLIMKQLNHLNLLINDLHLLSLTTAGELVLDREMIDLNELMQERINWLKPLLQNQDFTIRFKQQGPCVCLADPYRLGQVFYILMDNALRYAIEGKVLHISVTKQGSQWQIDFIDQGLGVSEVYLNDIFTRFSRAETSRSRHSGGSGLGLSIAKAICEAHQGSITATNRPAGGMQFTIWLPLTGQA